MEIHKICSETVTERAGASTELAETVTECAERVSEHFEASIRQCKIAVGWCGNVVELTLYLTSRGATFSRSPTKISLENAPTNNSRPMLDGCCLLILKQSVGVTENVAPTLAFFTGPL